MDFVRIKEIGKYEGQEVKIRGWVFNKRSSGKLHFLQIRDGSAQIQAVAFKGDLPEDIFNLADKVTQETSVEIMGIVNKHERSKIGFEI